MKRWKYILDATDFIPWTYEAEIQFSTLPNVGSPVVNVSMDIEGPPMPPFNLVATINCVTVDLTWELSPLYYPPVTFNVYRNDEFIANIPDLFYSDTSGYPEIPYEYNVTSVYSIGETFPSLPANTIIPLPDSLEPLNLELLPYYPQQFDISLWWDEPDGCLSPDGYNVYRDGYKINSELVEELNYIDPDIAWIYVIEYNVTAVYYFGESEFSNTAIHLNDDIEKFRFKSILIFPNPAKDKLFIESQGKIEKIEIYNSIGLSIISKKVIGKSYQLNVSQFNPGIYFIKIETEQDMILRKIMIE